MTDKNIEDYAQTLRAIRRARARLYVCFCTFPIYVFLVMRIVEAGQDTTMILLAYMALYACFGVIVALKRCPQCHQQFFVKSFFLNPFRSRCAHCELGLKPVPK